jgi:hypothetical protein
MDQLITMISERTGLPEAQARDVANMVINYIKGQLPPEIAAQVDLFTGGQASGDTAQQALGALGGLFGNKE